MLCKLLPTGDANPGNVVAMLKLMGKQQHPIHHEAIMTSSKALVEELSNQESLKNYGKSVGPNSSQSRSNNMNMQKISGYSI